MDKEKNKEKRKLNLQKKGERENSESKSFLPGKRWRRILNPTHNQREGRFFLQTKKKRKKYSPNSF